MNPEDEKGELVESGSFRVDRVRALEKLSHFRRRDVGCVMLFARAAAASGAKGLSIERSSSSIVLRFDGLPFSRGELADPYASLFDEQGGGDERRRWLALAMIHAWRPSLRRLEVVSGPEGAGAVVEADGLGSEKVAAGGTASGGTVVTLELASADEGHWRHPAAPELIVCNPRSHLWGRMTVQVSSGGRVEGRFTPTAAGPGELVFDEGGVYGHISVPPEPMLESSLDAYIHGVYAGRLDWRVGVLPVVGKADDPSLSLDASLASVVQNDRRERLESLVSRKAGELALSVAQDQPGLMGELAGLLRGDAALRALWKSRLDGPSVEAARASGLSALVERLFGGGARKEWEARVLYGACATAWLRHIAVELGSRGRDSAGAKLWAAVQAAPLAFAGGWRPVAMAELRAARQERRLVVTAEPPGEREGLVVWKDGGGHPFWAAVGALDL